MPNRYIRASAIESPAVNSLSWLGEVFYRRLLNRVDDFGRFTANHSLLRASIFPLQLDRAREADIPRLLAECEKAGLLFAYMAGGKQCLVVNKWEQGRAKHSEYPAPPENIRERMQTYVYGCLHMSPTPTPTPTAIPTTDSDHISSSELALTSNPGCSVGSIPAEAIYAAYPRKVGKTAAIKAIERVLKAGPITAETLLAKVEAYAAATSLWADSDRDFIPHPASWVNAGRYDDDPNDWARTSSRSTTAAKARSEQLAKSNGYEY